MLTSAKHARLGVTAQFEGTTSAWIKRMKLLLVVQWLGSLAHRAGGTDIKFHFFYEISKLSCTEFLIKRWP